MLTKKQISEIKEHLERAQNPLFLFDNDADGLCSALLLQRFIERGKLFPIRSFPDLDVSYFRRVRELDADYIFILDKPLVSEEFLKEAEKFNIPIVWIDHHEKVPKSFFKNTKNVFYYNPGEEPVTYLASQVTSKKEDLWLAVAGCISDKFLPDFYRQVREDFPDLLIESDDAYDVYYGSEIGKISKMLNAGLKNTTTKVIEMIKLLMKIKSPLDLANENSRNKFIYERYEHIEERINKLVKKVNKNESSKLIILEYSGDLSVSSEIANKLHYLFPAKFIVVMYKTEGKVNISGRGENIRDIIAKSIKDLPGSTSGGHRNAVGAKIMVPDLEVFKDSLKSLIK